jgi:hypothetical protein
MGAPTRIRTSDSLIGVSNSLTKVSGRLIKETAKPHLLNNNTIKIITKIAEFFIL